MAKTAQLGLPLVAPAQAQKHVTVNTALALLDAVAQLRVVSSDLAVPPSDSADGESYLVPAGAGGDWSGKSGQIAVWSNGGWIFLTPKAGWRAWDEGKRSQSVFDGSDWVANALAITENGSGSIWSIVEADHVVTAGAANVTSLQIPSHAQVLGVTGRVVESLTGPGLTTWRIGVAGGENRFGSGLGVGLNSYVLGLSETPTTYWEATPLRLTAEAGTFASGRIRLAIHLLQLKPPRAV